MQYNFGGIVAVFPPFHFLDLLVSMEQLSKLNVEELGRWLEEKSIPSNVIENFRGTKCDIFDTILIV